MNLKLSAILSALSITQTHAFIECSELTETKDESVVSSFDIINLRRVPLGRRLDENDEDEDDENEEEEEDDFAEEEEDEEEEEEEADEEEDQEDEEEESNDEGEDPNTASTQERNNWCNDSEDWKWKPVLDEDGELIPNPHVRKLDELDVLASLSSSCVETFYKISIKTIGEHGHIGVLAEPSCKDADNIEACVDCPSYVFHANLDAEHPDLLQKIVEEVVVVVDDKANVKPDIHHEIEYLYELQELLVAFKDVKLDDNKSYNLMFNNCGTFLIKMAHNLGIDPTDPDIINSVATMLSTTTKVGSVIGGSEYMARFIGNYVHAN